MRLAIFATASALLACSHKDAYVAATDAYKNDLGDIATYATLLDPASYGDADTRAVVPSAAEQGMTKICAIATDRIMVDKPKTDLDEQVVAALGIAKDACCAKGMRQQCRDAMAQEHSALSKLDAEAVKNGMPAGSLAPTAGQAKARAEVDAIRASTKPTAEESRLTKLWADPSATRATLEAACSAARASDPKKTTTCTDAADCVAQARANDTSDRCYELRTYIELEDMDATSQGSDSAKLCAEAKRKSAITPPVSMVAKQQAIAQKRCP